MTNIPTLSGPVQKPLSGSAPQQLVILLHGLGADGNDLIGLAPMLANSLPDALFVSPNAPFPCDMAPYGYQWFSMLQRDPQYILEGVQTAAPILNNFIDEQLQRYHLKDDRLALVGFSQGCMMALFVALRRKQPCAGVVGFSGALVGEELLAEELTAKPATLLMHGDADPVVPYACLPHAVQILTRYNVPLEQHTCRGLGHGIDPDGLELAELFLKKRFGV